MNPSIQSPALDRQLSYVLSLPAARAGFLPRSSDVFRVAAAAVLVAATAFLDEPLDARVRFGLVTALAWTPVAGALVAIRRRHRSRLADLAALVADVGVLVAGLLLLPSGAPAFAVLLVAVVALHAHTADTAVGVAAAAVAVSGVAIADALGPDRLTFGGFALAAVALACGAVVLIQTALVRQRAAVAADLIRHQEKTEAIMTGVAEAVMVTSARGAVREWNRAASRIFACPSEEAIGRRCHEVLGLRRDLVELDCRSGCAVLAARLDHDGDVEVWRPSATGERQPLLVNASPVVGGDGTVVEVIHSFRDITRLKQADEAKTLFLATASHELKTPLSVIQGFAELLATEPRLPSEQRAYALDAIFRRAAELNVIVDRLLMSSRIEAGRIELKPGPFDVAPIVRERCDALRAARGAAVTFTGEDSLPEAVVQLDAFITVVDHLLDNAVKYSAGGAPISVRASADPTHVVATFADHGIGMTPEQAAHCFDRFWQAEATDVRRFGGTGIGLYIVRSLVEAMGGTIDVVSAAGAGSTFTVRLRRADIGGEAIEREPSIIREFMRQVGVPARRDAT